MASEISCSSSVAQTIGLGPNVELKAWVMGLSDLAIKAIAHEMLNLVANHHREMSLYINYTYGVDLWFLDEGTEITDFEKGSVYTVSRIINENEMTIPCEEMDPLGGIPDEQAHYHPNFLKKIQKKANQSIHFTEKFNEPMETSLSKYGDYISELLKNDKSIEEGFIFNFSRISIRGKFELEPDQILCEEKSHYRSDSGFTFQERFYFDCKSLYDKKLTVLFEITTKGEPSSPFESEKRLYSKISHKYSVVQLVNIQIMISEELSKNTQQIVTKHRKELVNLYV